MSGKSVWVAGYQVPNVVEQLWYDSKQQVLYIIRQNCVEVYTSWKQGDPLPAGTKTLGVKNS